MKLKNLILQNHWANFNQTWQNASWGEGDSSWHRPYPREDNYEIAKKHWRNQKIFFSRIIAPISTKLGTKHPWVNGIQVCSKKNHLILIKIIMGFFSSLNQRYDIIICVYWFELFSQVSDVAHGPLVCLNESFICSNDLLRNIFLIFHLYAVVVEAYLSKYLKN